MVDIRLSETDNAILSLLAEGRNVPANIADELDFTRQYVQQRLKRMEEHGIVQNIGRGVYEIVEDPRDSMDTG
ncbi:helix-turn-helix transcriptional regulator [Halorarius litoreus]|uniref:helix-turn-helix transcriptional regulator n=1 Tax=Halorarius litoreus TaxID=2962676 RepID=UPI0020CFB3A8|nr:winged helix-turn-helix transcriptional regulator [Halorarius litoreus]